MKKSEGMAVLGLVLIYILAGVVEPCDGYHCEGISVHDDNQDFWHQQQQEEQQQHEEQQNAK